MYVLIAQSCLTLCDHMDYNPPGSSVHGIFRARILKWVAISCSRGSFWPRDQTWVSHIAGRLSTVWATRDDKLSLYLSQDSEIKLAPMFPILVFLRLMLPHFKAHQRKFPFLENKNWSPPTGAYEGSLQKFQLYPISREGLLKAPNR